MGEGKMGWMKVRRWLKGMGGRGGVGGVGLGGYKLGGGDVVMVEALVVILLGAGRTRILCLGGKVEACVRKGGFSVRIDGSLLWFCFRCSFFFFLFVGSLLFLFIFLPFFLVFPLWAYPSFFFLFYLQFLVSRLSFSLSAFSFLPLPSFSSSPRSPIPPSLLPPPSPPLLSHPNQPLARPPPRHHHRSHVPIRARP